MHSQYPFDFEPPRRGMSKLEWFAVVAALAVGVAGGLYYLNDETASAEEDMPAADGTPAGEIDSGDVDWGHRNARLSAAGRLEHELAALRKELAVMRADQQTAERRESPDAKPKPAPPQQDPNIGPRTLAFWNALNEIMKKEERMRQAPAGGLTHHNANGFIARRGKAARYAVTTIRNLDTSGIDPEVAALAGDIAAWYEEGADLNDRAGQLLTHADAATRRGAAGQSWADAEKAHHAAVSRLNRRGDELQGALSRKYGLVFPDLR